MDSTTTNAVWVEKYAPQTLDEVNVIPTVKSTLVGMTSLVNNIALIGSPGIGKSTVARLLCRKFAPHSHLWIDGSTDNGIDIVRNRIMDFTEKCSYDDSLKIVCIEEFDGFSTAAQDALRAVIESDLAGTKFILTANKAHKISSAIKSRCPVIEMVPVLENVGKLVGRILRSEGIAITDDAKKGIGQLIKRNFPDIRVTINQLQLAYQSGVFVMPPKYHALAATITQMIKDKKTVFDIRQYVVDNVEAFAGDYHQLMRDIFDIYVTERNIQGVKVIPDYMRWCAEVADQEVNFISMLYQLTH